MHGGPGAFDEMGDVEEAKPAADYVGELVYADCAHSLDQVGVWCVGTDGGTTSFAEDVRTVKEEEPILTFVLECVAGGKIL